MTYLNTISPNDGSRKPRKRVGRGVGSGFGKTAGRGHKGLKSRSGGSVKPGFEGGQMPLQRRLPKFGFTSRKSLLRQEVRLSELNCLSSNEVTIDELKKSGVIKKSTKYVKIIFSGEASRSFVINQIAISKGAREAIERAGGSIVGSDDRAGKPTNEETKD